MHSEQLKNDSPIFHLKFTIKNIVSEGVWMSQQD